MLASRSRPLSASEPSMAIDEVSIDAQAFRPIRNSAIAMLAIAARAVSDERSSPCA